MPSSFIKIIILIASATTIFFLGYFFPKAQSVEAIKNPTVVEHHLNNTDLLLTQSIKHPKAFKINENIEKKAYKNKMLLKSKKNEYQKASPSLKEKDSLSENGLLKATQVIHLLSNTEAFNKKMNDYISHESKKSLLNQSKFEEYLYTQPILINNDLVMNQLACNDDLCMVSLKVYNQKQVIPFLDQLQSSKTIPIQSLAMDQDDDHMKLIFPVNPKSNAFLVTE
jgi:hypothetical protein